MLILRSDITATILGFMEFSMVNSHDFFYD